uniref:T-cell receptor alpha/delta variable 25.0.3 n=1 Tax=Cyprinus carpio TaxID=7962 RepID=A0A8C2PQ57_CYPCA
MITTKTSTVGSERDDLLHEFRAVDLRGGARDNLCYKINECVSFGNVITPVESHVSGTEGDIISLSCSYSSARSLFWYHQYPGSAPEFLFLILHATGEVLQKSKTVDQDPRFSAKLNEKKTHVDLEISSAKVIDSALYYCALESSLVSSIHRFTTKVPHTGLL